MGRLEKQIIVGALGLVGLLLAIVVLKGLKPRQESTQPLFIDLSGNGGGEQEANPAPSGPEDAGFKPLPPMSDDHGAKEDSGSHSKPPVTVEPVQPQPVKPTPGPVGPRLYTIREGDILGAIAQKQLGSTRYLEELKRANPGIDEKHLVVGETLVLPVVDGSSPSGPDSQLPSDARVHVVAAGDSLWTIAEKYYQDGTQLKRIVAANSQRLTRGENSVLKVGMSLVIPR